MQFIEQLIRQDSAFFSTALVLVSALLLARIAPLPRQMQPMVWFGLLAKALALKVNHRQRAQSQQITAGILSTILLVVPFWAICAFLLELAAFPWFFNLALLYFCLSDTSFSMTASAISDDLAHQNKAAARKRLSLWVSRDTEPLSEVGISKTTIEKLAHTPSYEVVTAIIYVVIGGVPLVLAIRMVKQLTLIWSITNPKYQQFGRGVFLLSEALQALPSILWALTLALISGPKGWQAWVAPAQRSPLPASEYRLFRMTATTLNTELGGPRKYMAQKVVIPRLNRTTLPTASKIKAAQRFINKGVYTWISFAMVTPILWAILRYVQA